MIPVFQDVTIAGGGAGNCFNACIASILELTLRTTAPISPVCFGDWWNQWRVWMADRGYKLSVRGMMDPPKGYSIVSVYTERLYPEGHEKAGCQISHACVAFDGMIVHDPYPIPAEAYEIKYYVEVRHLTKEEKAKHEKLLSQGRCPHGYRVHCETCPPLQA